MRDAKISDTGCYLDNHRGHYITRDVIELAVEFGFIIGPFEQFAISRYDDEHYWDIYPTEALIELADEATNWLNSGQDNCVHCLGTGLLPADNSEAWRDKEGIWRCKACTGTGQGPRIAGQNFPPRVPEGFVWEFNDGDYGLYEMEQE